MKCGSKNESQNGSQTPKKIGSTPSAIISLKQNKKMVITVDNIENYCRICIKQLKSIKRNIFENLDEPDWSSSFKYLELDRTDGLPQYSCKACYRKIESVLQIRKTCLESAKTFREILNQTDVKLELDIDITKNGKEAILVDKECIEIKEKEENPEIENIELIEISSNLINDIDKTEDEIPLFIEDNTKREFESTNDKNSQLKTVNTLDNEKEDVRHFSSNNIIDKIEDETTVNHLKETSNNVKTKFRRKRGNIAEKTTINELKGSSINKSPESLKLKRGQSRNKSVYGSINRVIYNTSSKKRTTVYKCIKCKKRFPKKKLYELHMKKEGQKPYPCPHCDQGFQHTQSFNDHINAFHTDDAIVYSCPKKKCKKSYKKFPSLRKHCLRTHNASYVFIKKQAEKDKIEDSEENVDDLEEEKSDDDESSVTDDKPKKQKCSLCNKIHPNQKYTELCIKSQAGLKPYVCHICNKSYSSNGSLWGHKRLQHFEGEVPNEKCTFEGCKSKFTNKFKLMKHLKYAHKKKIIHKYDETFVCPHCGKNFNRKEKFQRHVYNHTGDFPFKCEKCKKGFLKCQEYEQHKLRCEGIKRFACELCDYKCVDKKELKKHHESKHTKAEYRKKYSCSHCDFKTFVKQSLKNHERVVHLGIKSYKCEYCHKCFGKLYHLKTHVMTHTGERPLQCTLCKRRFIQSQALKTHLKAHAKGTVRLKDEDK